MVHSRVQSVSCWVEIRRKRNWYSPDRACGEETGQILRDRRVRDVFVGCHADGGGDEQVAAYVVPVGDNRVTIEYVLGNERESRGWGESAIDAPLLARRFQ